MVYAKLEQKRPFMRSIFRNLVVYLVCSACGMSISNSSAMVASEKLVWSDDFSQSTSPNNPLLSGWGYRTDPAQKDELAVYCSPSSPAPCDPQQLNTFIGSDGYLHIQARRLANGKYTSAMLWTRGLKQFQYGRFEARMQLPSAPGFWPSFWMLGQNFGKTPWPDCGEIDIMENFSKSPHSIWGTIHGALFADGITEKYSSASLDTTTGFHNYGIIWSPQKISYYVDEPSKIYATFTPKSLPAGAHWPFDSQSFFLVLNMSVWAPATSEQQDLLVDYVKVWKVN